MISSAYYRELQLFSSDEFADSLSLSREISGAVIQRLVESGALKRDKSQSVNEIYSKSAGVSIDTCYYFDYVGIIDLTLLDIEIVIKCYPKFYSSQPNIRVMKTIVSALQKYNADNYYNGLSNGLFEQSPNHNFLSIILFILQDYYDHGLYTNQRDVLLKHGNGEINWNVTIDESFPILQDNIPVYLDYYTDETDVDNSNYITKLHQCILTDCFHRLKMAELDSLFNIDPVELYDGQMSDFGEIPFIKQQIIKELNVQFVTRKQLLLRHLYAYVDNEFLSFDRISLSFWGTDSFNLVWETACSNVFGNQLDTPLYQLSFPLKPSWENSCLLKLREIIKKPIWFNYSDSTTFETETLRPDIVSIVSDTQNRFFVILDAKYYNVTFYNGSFKGIPGINDVDKQYLYELSFSSFIKEHDCHPINAFLFPTEKNNTVIGSVEMPILKNLGLCPIHLILLSSDIVFTSYVNKERLDLLSMFNNLFSLD